MDCKIITNKREEKVLLVGARIIVYAITFNKNEVDRPTICCNIRMGRSCS
jgi:hypothetical protein